MRFLKKKVYLREPTSIGITQNVSESSEDTSQAATANTSDEGITSSIEQIGIKQLRNPARKIPSEPLYEPKKETKTTSSKTIVKNFGKAMCSFAASELALPYLVQIVKQGMPVIKNFQLYIKKKKNTVDSIESLRSLLLSHRGEGKEVLDYKNIFKAISIIFIKYFSVNWIFQGKMAHKQAHLRARYKMLRRVQNPEYFTYFKGFVKETDSKLE